MKSILKKFALILLLILFIMSMGAASCTKYIQDIQNIVDKAGINVNVNDIIKDDIINQIQNELDSYLGDTGKDSSEVKAKIDEIVKKYKTETYKNGVYTGSGQCFGFANTLFNDIHKITLHSNYNEADNKKYFLNLDEEENKNITQVAQCVANKDNKYTITADDVTEAFKKAKIGDFVQMKWGSNNTTHSAIFMGFDDDGNILFTHANYPGDNKIQYNQAFTPEKLASSYSSNNTEFTHGFTIYTPK